MPARELPDYWTPKQVRQILAAMPAGQPWLFALLLWRSALCQAEANRDGDKWREKFASSDVSAGSSYTVTRLTPGIAYYFIVGRKEGDDITLGNFATPCGERVHVYSVGPPCGGFCCAC